MKRSIALVAVLVSGFVLSATAQSAPTSAAPSGQPVVAIISFEAAVSQTNEFQRNFADMQKKFDPKRAEIKALGDEIDNLTRQLQSQGEKLSDAERAKSTKTLESKNKQAQRLTDDAKIDFKQEMQQLYSGVASKVEDLLSAYARQQGYTLVVDVTQQAQQPRVVLYAHPSTDITRTIIDAYNVKSGVPAPPAPPSAATPNTGAKPTLAH